MPAEYLNNLQAKFYGMSSYFNKDVTIFKDLTGLAQATIIGKSFLHDDVAVTVDKKTKQRKNPRVAPRLFVDGNTFLYDDVYLVRNPSPFPPALSKPPNLTVEGNITCEKTVTAPTFVGEKFTGGNFSGTFNGTINVQSWKGFDIKHPNKPNHRLRHICLEGPEAGVYHRGRLTNSNIIDIPEYWINLIDPESITVSLTQIGYSQDLIVDKIEWGRRIFIKSGTGANIDCYYVIHASRVDGEKLIVEYEGETPADYPGDPTQYSISGYDYGKTT